jgi:hypothetical protein
LDWKGETEVEGCLFRGGGIEDEEVETEELEEEEVLEGVGVGIASSGLR